jgi:hypothetical protein
MKQRFRKAGSLARWNQKGKAVREFVFKCVVYFIFFGLPLSVLAFLILGCIWLGKAIF